MSSIDFILHEIKLIESEIELILYNIKSIALSIELIPHKLEQMFQMKIAVAVLKTRIRVLFRFFSRQMAK